MRNLSYSSKTKSTLQVQIGYLLNHSKFTLFTLFTLLLYFILNLSGGKFFKIITVPITPITPITNNTLIINIIVGNNNIKQI